MMMIRIILLTILVAFTNGNEATTQSHVKEKIDLPKLK